MYVCITHNKNNNKINEGKKTAKKKEVKTGSRRFSVKETERYKRLR